MSTENSRRVPSVAALMPEGTKLSEGEPFSHLTVEQREEMARTLDAMAKARARSWARRGQPKEPPS